MAHLNVSSRATRPRWSRTFLLEESFTVVLSLRRQDIPPAERRDNSSVDSAGSYHLANAHSIFVSPPLSTALEEADIDEESDSLAELIERLGDIPLNRIRLHPAPGTATEDDVIAALEAPRKRICELIDGVLVEQASEYPESILTSWLIVLRNAFVRPRNLGLVSSPDGTLRLWAGRVRIPDVAFTSWDRMPGRKRPTKPIPELSPDLAVEVLSPSNTKGEMQLKLTDYFSVNVRLVWIVDPQARTVKVYTGLDDMTLLSERDTLDGGAVLPGFSVSLADLFAELDRQG